MRSCWHSRISQTLVIGALLMIGNPSSFAQVVTYTYDSSGNLTAILKSQSSGPPGPGPVTISHPPQIVQQFCATLHCGVPAQPKLVSGGLHGHRVCGNFAGLGTIFSFTCPASPSSLDSGWLLTPLFWTNPDGKSHLNKAVVLTISTPTQTELFVEFENLAGSRIEQQQVTRQLGDDEIRNVGLNGQVAVAVSDDATNRTWTLQFLLNTCTDVAKLNIYTVGSSGTTNGVRSNPINVWLLRDPAELGSCS